MVWTYFRCKNVQNAYSFSAKKRKILIKKREKMQNRAIYLSFYSASTQKIMGIFA
jgi:hypothetical protein